MSYRYARTSRFLLATLCALYATSPLSAQAIDPAKSYREAQALMANGEIYRAVDALMAATAANPAYADAWAALAQCHYELREYERSLEFLAQAVRYGPRTNEIMDLEGFCYLAVGRLDDARASFSAAIAKLPGDRD
ncbi:MAG TPA: tetratricopeptide repeat protein, partial [Spirochaetales bacterium]|nr:tetratricopeptide repeat protein [Spirochaetales bacterium]